MDAGSRLATRRSARRRQTPALLLALALLAVGGGLRAAPALLGAEDEPPAAVLTAPPGPARAARVVIVSADGLRPDAIPAAEAAQLERLIRAGTYFPNAQTVRPPVTLPSHVSMLSGLHNARHGVSWNSHRPGYLPHPTLFSVVTQQGETTAMLFAKTKLHLLAHPRSVHWLHAPQPERRAARAGGAEEDLADGEEVSDAPVIARAFARVWPNGSFALTFVHFREVDSAGHRSGWMTPAYLEAVRGVDAALATIVASIEGAGGFARTALIVTADHGGFGRSHHRWLLPERAENLTIPWICVGPGVPAGRVVERTLRTYDTAPTALALLGLGAPVGIDGEVVREVAGEAACRPGDAPC